MTLPLTIKYDNKEYSIFYHEDLIKRIATENNTFFEDWLLTELKNRVSSFDFTIDIGANIGNHSVFFKEVCKSTKLISFEPIIENFNLLKQNCPGSDIFNIALSDYNGTGLMSMRDSLFNNSGTPALSDSGILVNVATLDSFNFTDVTFIKIDVEGHELSVLRGAKETIELYKPDILVEIHLGITENDVLQLLPIGYSYEKITHESHFLYKFKK